ncbi:hypothetical protein [Flavisolibacter nicotianae]|uniref:hypothetical protein n=1 Tax=Flavisolibacter nicotianae TaxID=2364882 RepID=UPI000EB0C6B3|nr:hypothetical protein [Flavisolibacter nicotianae]
MTNEYFFEKTLGFIHSIGIETSYCSLPEQDCFLPGLSIEEGRILIDKEKLRHHGDVLHEAAHLAVVPAADRNTLSGPAIGQRKDAPAEEMMAIAWSYAACIHLSIDPHFVFHGQGYQGGGESIVENFSNGNYIGVPMLQWLGLTTTAPGADSVYPVMKKWLRD